MTVTIETCPRLATARMAAAPVWHVPRTGGRGLKTRNETVVP